MIRRNHCHYLAGIITIFFSLQLNALASPTFHSCRHDQRDALLEFRDEFPMDESYPIPWNKSSDYCLWEGVTCDDKFGQVISLDLQDTSLNSSLKSNSSLFRLRYLRYLNLNDCNLQGKIPSSLGNLSSLLILQVGNNHLVGEVPASIGNLKELRVMSIGNNSLSGNIPNFFANLTKLSYFSLRSNNFTSFTFPSNMSGFHNLGYFDVSENSLVGPFPKSLFSIPSLQWVSLGVNQFTGPIEFANTSTSSQLQYLYLTYNRFDSQIPKSISEFLNLEIIDLEIITSLASSPSTTLSPKQREQIQRYVSFSNGFEIKKGYLRLYPVK